MFVWGGGGGDNLKLMLHYLYKGEWCRSGGASDSQLRGPGFYSQLASPCCVLEQDTFTPYSTG